MKKNGFISTSLIYTFFIVFLLLMVYLLNSYSRVRFLLEEYRYDIKNSFAEVSGADINLYFMAWDETTKEYELTDEMPSFGYVYEPNFSYCKNGSTMSYANGNISVTANRKDSCYAYFKEAEKDVVIRIYTKESTDSARVLVKNIPGFSYEMTKKTCSNGANLIFNEQKREFTITASEKTVCEVEFTKREMDIKINLYKEDAYGTHEDNGTKYVKVSEIPGNNYSFSYYKCTNSTTIITSENNELLINAEGKDECNVYYKGGTNKVEIIIMQETENGVSGYTTGKKYSRVYSIPSSGYGYVGYICDNNEASVEYSGGTLYSESDIQTTCWAYFNKYNDNVLINYYLEKTDGTYENVVSVPSLGYNYNKEKSGCRNGSELIVENNVAYVTSSTSNEVCDVYFDIVNADIKVLVYVLNKETQKYELGNVPGVGYKMSNPECTNGASIEYIDSKLKVTSEGPTVCTVYFR